MKHLNFKNFKNFTIVMMLLAVVLMFTGCTFVGDASLTGKTPDFLMGIWHGLVAPYTLIIRWFIHIKMYAIVNTGWTYDAGFLIGLIFSIPVGWLAAIVSIIYFLT